MGKLVSQRNRSHLNLELLDCRSEQCDLSEIGHHSERTAVAWVHFDSAARTLEAVARPGDGADYDHRSSTTVLEYNLGRLRKLGVWTGGQP
jgi:hypothetical protein